MSHVGWVMTHPKGEREKKNGQTLSSKSRLIGVSVKGEGSRQAGFGINTVTNLGKGKASEKHI